MSEHHLERVGRGVFKGKLQAPTKKSQWQETAPFRIIIRTTSGATAAGKASYFFHRHPEAGTMRLIKHSASQHASGGLHVKGARALENAQHPHPGDKFGAPCKTRRGLMVELAVTRQVCRGCPLGKVVDTLSHVGDRHALLLRC